jgi:hypothetical protein
MFLKCDLKVKISFETPLYIDKLLLLVEAFKAMSLRSHVAVGAGFKNPISRLFSACILGVSSETGRKQKVQPTG